MTEKDAPASMFIEVPIYGRMFNCVAFSSMGECVSTTTGERELHPASFCLHPDNGDQNMAVIYSILTVG